MPPDTERTPVQEAFDRSAPTYDDEFAHQAVPLLLRELVWREADRVLPRRARLLDLGCGTGEDAVYFADRYCTVVGIDASREMIKEGRAKLRKMRVEKSRVDLRELPVERVSELSDAAPFDAALANFGVLNCVADLGALARDLAGLLAPGAPFVAVIAGLAHLPTEVDLLRRGELARLFQRLRDPARPVPVKGLDLPVRCWKPSEVARDFAPHFALERTRGLGILLPPPHLSGFYRRHRVLFQALERIEEAGGHLPVVREMGDHTLLVFRRTG